MNGRTKQFNAFLIELEKSFGPQRSIDTQIEIDILQWNNSYLNKVNCLHLQKRVRVFNDKARKMQDWYIVFFVRIDASGGYQLIYNDVEVLAEYCEFSVDSVFSDICAQMKRSQYFFDTYLSPFLKKNQNII